MLSTLDGVCFEVPHCQSAPPSPLLLTHLEEKKNTRWAEAVDNIDFTHSSRLAWRTVNKLTGTSAPPRKCPISANSIASQLVNNGAFKDKDREFTRLVAEEVSDRWRAHGADLNLSGGFSAEELAAALHQLKPGKAPGPDHIRPGPVATTPSD